MPDYILTFQTLLSGMSIYISVLRSILNIMAHFNTKYIMLYRNKTRGIQMSSNRTEQYKMLNYFMTEKLIPEMFVSIA